MPHQATWRRVFGHASDLPAREARLTSFFLAQQHRAEVPERGRTVLALEGKTLRGTIPAGQSRGVHLLAAFLPERGVVLAQALVEGKANELVVAPTVLAQLPRAGVVVVGDACTPNAPCVRALSRPTATSCGLWAATSRACCGTSASCSPHRRWQRAGACRRPTSRRHAPARAAMGGWKSAA